MKYLFIAACKGKVYVGQYVRQAASILAAEIYSNLR